MSSQHGDKARFHRIRKQNIARRLKVRELRLKLVKVPVRVAGLVDIEKQIPL